VIFSFTQSFTHQVTVGFLPPRYDAISAYELFRLAGVSKEAYEQFLRPTLLVGLFAPPERISAAAMLETLYFYAMCSQNAFGKLMLKGYAIITVLTCVAMHQQVLPINPLKKL
jgi:uncharacterized protein with NAD-binding domain and iron-sulfur cluster